MPRTVRFFRTMRGCIFSLSVDVFLPFLLGLYLYVPKLVGTVLKMLPGFLQAVKVKDFMEFRHHMSDIRRKKSAAFHSVDDIATASVIVPGLVKEGFHIWIILHINFLLDRSSRAPRSPSPPAIFQYFNGLHICRSTER